MKLDPSPQLVTIPTPRDAQPVNDDVIDVTPETLGDREHVAAVNAFLADIETEREKRRRAARDGGPQ